MSKGDTAPRYHPTRGPLRDTRNKKRSSRDSSGPPGSSPPPAPLASAPVKSSSTSQQDDTNSPVVENKRISAVVDSEPNSKRNSAISTTSTGSGKSKRKTHIGPWQLGRTLGKGSTGRVRLAKHALTGQVAAIKIVSKKYAAMAQSQSIAAMDQNRELAIGRTDSKAMPCGIEREVVIMKLIEHPNIINLYDVWENRGELYAFIQNLNYAFQY